MYRWELLGQATTAGSLRSGIGEDLALIMRMIEADLATLSGCAGYVAEVVPRMSVLHLDAVYVATGRMWLGRRDQSGAVSWKELYRRPADPDCDMGCASYATLLRVARADPLPAGP